MNYKFIKITKCNRVLRIEDLQIIKEYKASFKDLHVRRVNKKIILL